MEFTPIKRDWAGRYLFPDPTTGGERAYTRVTTLAKALDDTFFLDQWKQRQVIKGLSERHDLYTLACATPIEDKKTLNGIAKDAMNALPSRANLGTAVHAATENADRNETYNLPAQYRADVRAYVAAREKLGLEVEPEYIEAVLVNDAFDVAGTTDRFLRATRATAELVNAAIGDLNAAREKRGVRGRMETSVKSGELLVADVKTGSSVDFGGSAMPIQLAAYATAGRIMDKATGALVTAPYVNTDVGLIFHVPAGEGKAYVHIVDLVEGKQGAGLAQAVLRWQRASGPREQTRMAKVGRVVKAPDDVPLDRAILMQDTRAGLEGLYIARQDEFTSQHVDAVRARLKDLGIV